MVIRLLGTIAGFVILASFVGFNLDNKCNVSLIFKTFENVPVFITIMISFSAGLLFTLPFALTHRVKKAKKEKQNNVPAAVKDKKEKNDKKEKAENIAENKHEENTQTTELETGSPV
ncbi:MAG: hypothetical protein II367_01920 [Treponema sp.]|nr:hypothetical protein [Treponema sp.]